MNFWNMSAIQWLDFILRIAIIVYAVIRILRAIIGKLKHRRHIQSTVYDDSELISLIMSTVCDIEQLFEDIKHGGKAGAVKYQTVYDHIINIANGQGLKVPTNLSSLIEQCVKLININKVNAVTTDNGTITDTDGNKIISENQK